MTPPTEREQLAHLVAAARAIVIPTENALRWLNPDEGCGYLTYKSTWDSLRSALTALVDAADIGGAQADG